MTAAKEIIEVFINLNIVLVIACFIWFAVRSLVAKSALRHAYALQYQALKTVLVLVILSPVLAVALTSSLAYISPGKSVVLSDIVVAAYLRGDFAMDAVRFEEILNSRADWTEQLVTMKSPILMAAAGLLAFGMMCFVVQLVRAVCHVRQMLADSYLWKRVGPVDIRLSDTIAIPVAARGLLRRHIVLPSDMIRNSENRRIAIAHELQHFRQADIEWEILLELMRPFLFWNPAFVLLKRQFDKLRELNCDQSVMAKYRFSALDYARCLLDFCERSVGRKSPQPLKVALVASGQSSARQELAVRLLSLKATAAHQSVRRLHLAGFACLAAILLALAAASLNSPKDWSHDRLMLSTVVNLERLRR